MTAKYLLESKMKLYQDTQAKLAEVLNISLQTFNIKINSKDGACFTQNEILALKNRYKLSADEVNEIFFADGVSCEDEIAI